MRMELEATFTMEDGKDFGLTYQVKDGIVGTDTGMGYQQVCRESDFLHHLLEAQWDGVTNIVIKAKDLVAENRRAIAEAFDADRNSPQTVSERGYSVD